MCRQHFPFVDSTAVQLCVLIRWTWALRGGTFGLPKIMQHGTGVSAARLGKVPCGDMGASVLGGITLITYLFRHGQDGIIDRSSR